MFSHSGILHVFWGAKPPTFISGGAKAPLASRFRRRRPLISSPPAEQAKSPAGLGLTNFVVHVL